MRGRHASDRWRPRCDAFAHAAAGAWQRGGTPLERPARFRPGTADTHTQRANRRLLPPDLGSCAVTFKAVSHSKGALHSSAPLRNVSIVAQLTNLLVGLIEHGRELAHLVA